MHDAWGDDGATKQDIDSAALTALRGAIGDELQERNWPVCGQVVKIFSAWDGPTVHGSPAFLVLAAGDTVRIAQRADDGLLYGIVQGVGGRSNRAGWFGGPDCKAVYEVAVPLGPQDPIDNVPTVPTVKSDDGIEDDKPVDVLGDVGEDEAGDNAGDSDVIMEIAEAPEGADSPKLPSSETRASGRQFEANGSIAKAVDEYIEQHGVDSLTGQTLRELDPKLQEQLIARQLGHCKNPSAVLRSRIERMLSNASKLEPIPMAPVRITPINTGPITPPIPLFPQMLPRSRSPRIRDRPLPPLPVNVAAPVAAALRVVPGTAGASLQLTAAELLKLGEPRTLQGFVQRYRLSEEAENGLGQMPRWAQDVIIKGTPTLGKVRNPSAVVLARIQALKQSPVEEYIAGCHLEQAVAAELRDLPLEEQLGVIEMDPTLAPDPSAAVAARILAVRSQRRSDEEKGHHSRDESEKEVDGWELLHGEDASPTRDSEAPLPSASPSWQQQRHHQDGPRRQHELYEPEEMPQEQESEGLTDGDYQPGHHAQHHQEQEQDEGFPEDSRLAMNLETTPKAGGAPPWSRTPPPPPPPPRPSSTRSAAPSSRRRGYGDQYDRSSRHGSW
eukprot:TRINITY_DN7484_c0_g1_i1.p1 TRINITY_DN7484_c0_g1~~TRINITY_DN7484_c0_g1_i1.p1  ORF type:complete len:649 (+),score=117.87 TRINITY_DN7484_c0_g1_i1:110-1948(+)